MASYKQELIDVLAELKQIEAKIENGRLSPEEQAFVRALIEESKYKTEVYRRVLEKIITGTVWTVLVASCMGMLFMFKEFLLK